MYDPSTQNTPRTKEPPTAPFWRGFGDCGIKKWAILYNNSGFNHCIGKHTVKARENRRNLQEQSSRRETRLDQFTSIADMAVEIF